MRVPSRAERLRDAHARSSTRATSDTQLPDITHGVTIQASPEKVYEAITTAEGIRSWWTRYTILDPRVGGMGEFAFFKRAVVTRVKVEELVPHKRVVWTTISSDAPGDWNGTKITFDLRAQGTDTVVAFAHRGFKQANDEFAKVTGGWWYYLLSLKQYLETGKGKPHPDV